MKLKEIAAEIYSRLKKLEADPANAVQKLSGGGTYLHFYQPNVWAGRKYIYVRYKSYQSESRLTKAQAREYLEWLRGGNVGTHYTMEKEEAKSE
jgi:hypothetical protein